MKIAVWVCVSVLGACSRASTPPPPAASVAQPPVSAPPAAQPPAATQPPPPPATQPRPVTPPPPPPTSSATAAPSQDCSKLETAPEYQDLSAEARARSLTTCRAKEEFRAFVAARQSCSAASECAIVPGSCPFGCFVPVAKASAPEVAAKLDALGARLDKAGNRCVYRCMSPPAATCVDSRCSTGKP